MHDWDVTHAQVPVVDTLDQKILRIYYASRDSEGRSNASFIEVESTNPSKIIYKHDRPILTLGKLGSFDESGIMPTCIIQMNHKKYLYYIGWSIRKTVPYQNSIGLAISVDDGLSFEKFSEGPIVGVNSTDPYFVGTFYVLKEHDLLRGYYLSCTGWEMHNGKPEPLYVLKYAESYDGINWNRDGKVVVNFSNSNEGGLVSASVIKELHSYRMWFGRRNKSDYRQNIINSYRLGYAESVDGVVWTRKDSLVGIDVSPSGWDSEMISYPYVVKINNQLVMFYNGNGFGRTGFGHAILINDNE